jgi:peptidyl-prolyl cis-trans isomerase A (cyclophilin A)
MQRRQLLALSVSASLHLDAFAQSPVRTRVETALGSFLVAVDTAAAPLTAANYLAYVDGRHLDNASVYRIVTLANQAPATAHKIEVVQWGMNLPEGKAAPFPPIRHESTRETGLRHRDGTISMARSAPGTADSEFFICVGEQPELDFGGRRNPDGLGFAAFGQVVEGMDVVRALHARGKPQQVLAEPIPVRSVRRV